VQTAWTNHYRKQGGWVRWQLVSFERFNADHWTISWSSSINFPSSQLIFFRLIS
jgi:hypothetical protein